MDQDFEVEIYASEGLSLLKDFLPQCPIELALEENEVGELVLRQKVGSQIAGFEFEAHEGYVYVFLLYVTHKSIKPASYIIPAFSAFLKTANFPHKITEILHEVDFDELWVEYEWPKNT
ncbi:hypothetical protein [Marinobacter xestospongiae]|uniref:hypothetical protein n=1 Tax=Marinobacter xestospongiae TaxID=994319 RepID=UPI0020044B72|nr:hypothetical protein [Marinobacter xestospongiae]MCK7565850.1 hypothetical protein [Marinobacter xestospongiae]